MPSLREELRRLVLFLTLIGALAACSSGEEPAAGEIDEPAPSGPAAVQPPPPAVPAAPAVAPDRVEPDRYLGIRHPPLPARVEKLGGGLIEPPGVSAAEAGYGFAEVREGRSRVLWLSKLLDRTAEGEPVWEVRDALVLPELSAGEIFTFVDCRRGEETGYAAVVARDDSAERLTEIRRAWRADLAAERIEPADGAGITCENVGYGTP